MRPRGARALHLRKPLARALHAGHPWLYRDALEPFDAEPGEVVTVLDKSRRFLARGLAEAGPIGVRVLTTRDEPLDAAFFARRIESALALRERVVPRATDAYRLLHGEGDRLPGMVCDRYGSFAVLQLDGAAATEWQERMCEWLRKPLTALGIAGLLVRARGERKQRVAQAWGDAPEDPIVVQEHGMKLCASLWHGQKTGLFLDHRESRRRVRELSAGLRVLNLYGYTGGFSVAASLGGASHVTTVDSAAPALELARRSFEANGLDSARHTLCAADVPEQLQALSAQRARFELIVADPPSFAPSEAAKPAALESYAALHTAALKLLAPGGLYLAASCSSHVTREDFELSLREGARRARRVLQLLERAGAPADHPRLLGFPEGDYLKVVLLRAW